MENRRPILSKPTNAREMVIDFLGDIMITIHTDRPPSDPEWREYIDSLRGRDLTELRSIVFTDGGAPSSKQRKELNEFLSGTAVNGIVVSESLAVRGVVTALSWFNPKIKPFAPDDFQAGLTYLKILPEEREAIREAVDEMRTKLSNPDVRAIPKRFLLTSRP